MNYISTRNNCEPVSAASAIAQGMVPAGGLFVPQSIPALSADEIASMAGKSYQEIARWILGKYLTDYTAEDIADCVAGAYNTNFDTAEIAPLVKLNDNEYILELWHGPTAAFKDMALQLTPRLLVKAIEKLDLKQEVIILVATSGDTGKAALEGFKNVKGTRIIVFYPAHGVSRVQELQMVTTDGDNTYVVGVEGNFDDCQSAVKEIFADQALKETMAQNGYQFSSANSINWGRLLPQIVYYFAAYLNLVNQNAIAYGDNVDFVVPTGNFGNILAAWYAGQMGLPVGKLVCASNKNRILTDFFATGVYDRRRDFFQTNSPSMDILISSNLERFLFAMTGNNGDKVAQWMDALKQDGIFTVDAETKANIDKFVVGGAADEAETLAMIKQCYVDHGYVLDTHTAVALKVSREQNSGNVAVVDSTAHPCKFVSSVLAALNGAPSENSELEQLEELVGKTGIAQHSGLQDLDKKPVRHNMVCEKEGISAAVQQILGL